MNTTQLRPLTDYEKRLIDHLLGERFSGRDALVEQVHKSLVRQIDSEGSLDFHVKTNLKAEVQRRIPIEGEFEDLDGVVIHVLLHVVDGVIKELEFFKEDGSQVIKLPDPSNLRLFKPD